MRPCLDVLEQKAAKWERVRACVTARMAVLPVLRERGPDSPEVKAAVYRYLAESDGYCRHQHSLSWVQEANKEQRRASQAHMHLIHRVPSLLPVSVPAPPPLVSVPAPPPLFLYLLRRPLGNPSSLSLRHCWWWYNRGWDVGSGRARPRD
jgi:hypothetical protein